MTLQDYIAEQTERVAAALADFAATTALDRLNWEPSGEGSGLDEGGGKGRSVLDQIAECVGVNFRFAALLRGEPASEASPALQTAASAQEQLTASAAELAAAIRGLSDDALEAPLQLPRGPLLTRNLMLAPYRNMAYHAGQINFIQMLAGDTEFHSPPTWF